MSTIYKEKRARIPETLRLNNKAPQVPIQRMILFFKSPFPGLPTSLNIGGETGEFEERILDAITHNLWGSESMLRNYISAIECIKDGYAHFPEGVGAGLNHRRTGEPTHVHSLRVLYRGLQEQERIKPKEAMTEEESSIFHVSLLSRILHDAQEDLTQFSISPPDKLSKISELTYRDSRAYPLDLTSHERRLLLLQLNALSIPKKVDKIKDEENDLKIQKQVKHLLNVTKTIYKEYRSLAAYLTLRAKIDDRIDNICTFYQIGDENKIKKFYLKLRETSIHFRGVEDQAQVYFKEYNIKRYGKRGHIPPAQESAVALCQNLVSHGGYEELFLSQIIGTTGNEMFLVPNFTTLV